MGIVVNIFVGSDDAWQEKDGIIDKMIWKSTRETWEGTKMNRMTSPKVLTRIARAMLECGRSEEAERIVSSLERWVDREGSDGKRVSLSSLISLSEALDKEGRFEESDRIMRSVVAGMNRSAQTENAPWWERATDRMADFVAPMFEGQQRATDARTQKMYEDRQRGLLSQYDAIPANMSRAELARRMADPNNQDAWSQERLGEQMRDWRSGQAAKDAERRMKLKRQMDSLKGLYNRQFPEGNEMMRNYLGGPVSSPGGS